MSSFAESKPSINHNVDPVYDPNPSLIKNNSTLSNTKKHDFSDNKMSIEFSKSIEILKNEEKETKIKKNLAELDVYGN